LPHFALRYDHVRAAQGVLEVEQSALQLLVYEGHKQAKKSAKGKWDGLKEALGLSNVRSYFGKWDGLREALGLSNVRKWDGLREALGLSNVILSYLFSYYHILSHV
jgi:hypothetical protein